MFAKTLIICSVVAAAAAITPGYLDGAYALGAQSEHTVRGFAGLSSVSKQSKAVDGPYSSVRKTDIRVTNDGAYAAHPVAYGHGYAAAPAVAHGYAAPLGYAGHGYAAPALAHGYAGHGYAAPALAHGYAGHGYAAPALAHGYAAPAVAHGYAAPLGYAGHGYAAPALAHGYAGGAAIAKTAVASGLGVAYSPATAVASHSFSGLGIHYGY